MISPLALALALVPLLALVPGFPVGPVAASAQSTTAAPVPASTQSSAASAPASGAAAALEASEPFWSENAELMLTLTPFDSAAPPRAGEIFDSADYQQMLLVPADWDLAYVLDLVDGAVTAFARAAVLGAEGRPSAPDPRQARPAGVFVSDGDGQMIFADDLCEVAVGPTPPLIGEVSRAELDRRQPAYARRARAYRPDPSVVAAFEQLTEPLELIAFFGTWCGTCKHHLPGLMATLDQADNERIKITYVGVDENVAEPEDWLARCGVHTTPAVVMVSGGHEVGRVEEEPRATLEADLAALLREHGVR